MAQSSNQSSITDSVIVFFATGGLIGYAPIAPGTFGSLAALPLCLWLATLNLPVALVLTAVLILVAVWTAHRASGVIGQHDAKEIVIDEICGMAVTLIGVPPDLSAMIWGFILFRVFDIVKPFPIRWVDKHVPGGWGIVMDDVLAGLVASGLIHFCHLY